MENKGINIKEIHYKKKNKKIVIKDKKKFIRAIGILVGIIVLVLIFSLANKKIVIDDTTNITELKVKKYAEEIKGYYEKEGMEQKFLDEYNNILNVSWTYIYNNLVGEQTIETLGTQVNNVLASDDWSVLGIEKNTRWKGTWTIDVANNTLKFKFETSDIEPSWISNDMVTNCVEKNKE